MRMRKLLLTCILLISGLLLQAQYSGYSAVADLVKFKEQFTFAAQKTISIKSDFVQEKNLSMLSEKIVSKGKFWFKKDNMVRMEYNQPFQYLMVINNGKVFIKDGQKENTIAAKSNKIFQQINKITVDCVQGTMLGNTDFKTRVFENKNNFQVELSPVVKGMKEFFKTINVIIDKKDYSVVSIQMNENGGDHTIIRFSNKELNTNIANAIFAIK